MRFIQFVDFATLELSCVQWRAGKLKGIWKESMYPTGMRASALDVVCPPWE